MYYVLIENNELAGVVNYEPNVPNTVIVTSISNEEYQYIMEENTHYFDLPTRTVKAHTQDHLDSLAISKETEIKNAEYRDFLNSTDWKILRHIRQKALGVGTSMTDAEYLALEQQRAEAAARIINN